MQRQQRNERIQVNCRQSPDGWSCAVTVGSGDDTTEHEVEVTVDELERLAPGATDPTRLVEASFVYLLEHEAKESILPRFALRTIASYFPDYPAEIGGRL